jgi:hypothetical protein
MNPTRRLTALALPIIALTTFGLPATGPASASEGTKCTFEADFVAAPGLSTSGSSGTVDTERDGKAACDGPVNGKQPSGPGTYSFKGHYGTNDPDTCQSGGEGDGVAVFAIPTSDGVERIVVKLTFTYVGFKAGVPFTGEFKGDTMSGTFDVRPVDGDCAAKPVTKYQMKGKGTLA